MTDQPKYFSDYSATEFLALIQEIMTATESLEYQDKLLEHFIEVVEHPDGSDLIYYSGDEQDGSAEQVMARIVTWRKSKGLSLFRDSR